MTDNRLYDIVTALATDQPTTATGLFNTIMGERVEDQVRSMTQNFSYAGPKPDATD
jgi:hypothetical protein